MQVMPKKRHERSFTISLDSPATAETVISFTVGGTATDTADYVISPTDNVTIPNGGSTAIIDVAVDSYRYDC